MAQSTQRVAVIGAGLAGLRCAALLQQQLDVTVYEKSGDIGGRLATRRRDGALWNHGAPSLAAAQPTFHRFLETLVGADSAQRLTPSGQHFIGKPDMRELLRPLSTALEIQTQQLVARIAPGERCRWQLLDERGTSISEADAVILAIPAPQARTLLKNSGLIEAEVLQDVAMTPCWTLLLALRTPSAAWLSTPLHEPIANLSPGRYHADSVENAHTKTLVVQASVDWSAANVELEPAVAIAALLEALQTQLAADLTAQVEQAQSHRWRYARTSRALGQTHYWSQTNGLGLTGDWCLGANAEDAFISAEALAEAVLRSMP